MNAYPSKPASLERFKAKGYIKNLKTKNRVTDYQSPVDHRSTSTTTRKAEVNKFSQKERKKERKSEKQEGK